MIVDLKTLALEGAYLRGKGEQQRLLLNVSDLLLADGDWCSAFLYFQVRQFPIYIFGHALIVLTACNYYEHGRKEKVL